MDETRRQWAFTIAVLFVLLGLTALGNNWLTVGTAVGLLVVGFVVLPRDRARGALAALVAGCVAAAFAAVLR